MLRGREVGGSNKPLRYLVEVKEHIPFGFYEMRLSGG